MRVTAECWNREKKLAKNLAARFPASRLLHYRIAAAVVPRLPPPKTAPRARALDDSSRARRGGVFIHRARRHRSGESAAGRGKAPSIYDGDHDDHDDHDVCGDCVCESCVRDAGAVCSVNPRRRDRNDGGSRGWRIIRVIVINTFFIYIYVYIFFSNGELKRFLKFRAFFADAFKNRQPRWRRHIIYSRWPSAFFCYACAQRCCFSLREQQRRRTVEKRARAYKFDDETGKFSKKNFPASRSQVTAGRYVYYYNVLT